MTSCGNSYVCIFDGNDYHRSPHSFVVEAMLTLTSFPSPTKQQEVAPLVQVQLSKCAHGKSLLSSCFCLSFKSFSFSWWYQPYTRKVVTVGVFVPLILRPRFGTSLIYFLRKRSFNQIKMSTRDVF